MENKIDTSAKDSTVCPAEKEIDKTQKGGAESSSAQPPVHKRRVRYSGTHPRSYKEKYK